MKKLFCFCLFITFAAFVSAQQFDNNNYNSNGIVVNQRPDWTSRIFTGGTLGLAFGSESLVDISPMIGYKVTDKFQVGVGVTYQYWGFNDYGFNLSSNVYGGRLFARYFIFKNIFAYGEYEWLNVQPIYTYIDPAGTVFYAEDVVRQNVYSPFVGGGYRQQLSGKAAMYLLILYDLNYNSLSYTPYSGSPWVVRIGMDVGF